MKFFMKPLLFFRIISCSMILTMLNACSGPQVKKSYNEIDKNFVCRLEPAINQGGLKLISEKVDNQKVALLFSLVSYSYLTDMHADPKILIKVYSDGLLKEEMHLQAISKHWDIVDANKSQHPSNLDYASVTIDKAKFEQIANADKVDFIVQTNQDPIKSIFSKKSLTPFKEFLTACF